MDFESFMTYLLDGAYDAFNEIVSELSVQDVKSLRLVLRSMAPSLFPYMFKRLFLSIHDTDLAVFKNVVSHPIARRNITQICWDGSMLDSEMARQTEMGSFDDRYADCLAQSKDTPVTLWGLPDDVDKGLQRHSLSWVLDFWTDEAEKSEANMFGAADMLLLKESLSNMPHLRRINLVSRKKPTRVHPTTYLDMWQTPRAREWAKFPFYDYMLDPIPYHSHMKEGERESIRAMRCLIALCEEKCASVGSIIVAPFGNHTRLTARSVRVQGELEFPNVEPDVLTNDPTALIPDLPNSSKLTLRLMIEATPNDSTMYSTASIWETHLNMLMEASQNDLEELTLSEINLDKFVDRLQSYEKTFGGPHPLMTCTALRKIRINSAWCSDPTRILKWIRENTTVTEIELQAVYSSAVSWHTVLTRMQTEATLFDSFDMLSCRSPAEIWGFSLEILAPWNGESEKVVPWLRGETHKFPLWQGPG